MAYPNPNPNPNPNPSPSAPPLPLYPEVLTSNPESTSPFLSSSSSSLSTSSSLYPSIDMSELVEDLFPETPKQESPAAEETLLSVPGAILHLIDKHRSVELSTGHLSLLRLRQGQNTVALLARVSSGAADFVQWPLTLDAAAVKLDESHYFFSLRVPGDSSSDPLNYGLTFASKGQERALRELDGILDVYCSFSVQKVNQKEEAGSAVLDGSVAKEVTPAELMEAGPNSKREMMEERSAAYWTALAPNVEDYSGLVAKGIALGSGRLIQGILWCGDVAVDRIRWGDELLKRRMEKGEKPAEISKEALERIKRVKKVTKMSEKVAGGILTGVVKVSGYVTTSVVNSKAGKKVFSYLPEEVVLASLDGFGKICDAVEVAGKNVLSTSSVVTTGLVSHRYGEQAAEATNEGLDAAGHAIGAAWTIFKIRKAIDPKSALKPTTLTKSAVKAAAADLKAKMEK